MIRNHRAHAVCALLAAVAFAGCGGSSATSVKDYKKAASEEFTNIQSATQRLDTARDAPSKIAGLDALKASVNKAADRFDKLSPPDKAKSANSALVTELRTFAKDIAAVKQAAQTNNQAAGRATLPKLQVDKTKLVATLTELGQKLK
jgi:hypothetical protein